MNILPSRRSARSDLGPDSEYHLDPSFPLVPKSPKTSWFRRSFEISDLLIEKIPGQESKFLFSLKLKGAGSLNSGTLQNPDQRLLLLSLKGEAKECALLTGLISREVQIEEELLEGSLKVQDLEQDLQWYREKLERSEYENQVLKRSLMELSREPKTA